MEIINLYHQAVAILIARIFLGCLFFFQGFDAVFKVRIQNVIQTYQNTFLKNGIPKFLTVFAVWFTSCSALIGGILLTLGLFEYCALYVLGINLIITAIGFGINTAMWDTRFVFPRLLLLVFLLLVPETWNIFSLDYLLNSK
ncbi:MAG: DoxX family membrane protein [Sphingobacteriaceae bacterium]|nr:DoxX family membrane protein [Sphingobacteriaceae bacterium]